jgi:hypothetical protein
MATTARWPCWKPRRRGVDEFDEFSEFVLFDRGCAGDERPVSADCRDACAHGAPAMCDRDWCRCEHHAVVEIDLGHGRVSLVDKDDVELVGQYTWHVHQVRADETSYARRTWNNGDGTYGAQLMHTLITGWDQTDHRNGDGLDNRRDNLRQATHRQNHQNQRKRRGSASPFKGVVWHRSKRWRAIINVDGRRTSLGLFKDEKSAAIAYDAAARTHFGEYAALNFPGPGERPGTRPEEVEAWLAARAHASHQRGDEQEEVAAA